MARRTGKYKMTPRRRAALRKAQEASARKRRGSRFRGIKNFGGTALKIGGTIAAGAAIYHVEQVARDPGKAVRGYQTAKRWATGGPDPNAPGKGKNLRKSPIRYHSPVRPVKPIRGGVAGRRISPRQRGRQGRLF